MVKHYLNSCWEVWDTFKAWHVKVTLLLLFTEVHGDHTCFCSCLSFHFAIQSGYAWHCCVDKASVPAVRSLQGWDDNPSDTRVLEAEEQFPCPLLKVASQEMCCSPSSPSLSYTARLRTLCHYFGNTHSNIKLLLDLSSPHSSAVALLSLIKGF